MGIRTLLIDDDRMYRAAARRLLRDIDDVTVIGETNASDDLLPVIRQLDPDVAVLGIGEAVDEGLTKTVEIHARAPRTDVVVLAPRDPHPDTRLAMGLGARVYLTKGCDVEDLAHAVHQARAFRPERSYGSPQQAHIDDEATVQPTTPTEWERQVIALIAAGCKHAEIAERLGSSYRAIQGCHARVRHEMRLESRVDVVRYAAQEGLVNLPA